MLEGPTLRQLDVLREVFASVEKHGFPPTIRELGDRLGIASTNRISEHLKALAKKGLLERTRNTARGLKLTPRGRDYVTGRAA